MKENSQALIILTPGFPANETDSTCLPFPQLFVKTLSQVNPSLQVIVLAFQYPFVKKEYRWNNLQVIAFGGRNKGKFNRLMVWKAVLKKVQTIVKQQPVIGILSFWLGECGLIGKYAAKKYRLKHFTWLLGQDARANNRYVSFVRPHAQSLIALSDYIAGEFYRNYKIKPANIIPPGVNTNEAVVKDRVRDIDVLGAGSLIPLKQYVIFVTVIARLAVTHPSIRAVLCGDGIQWELLQKLIDGTGLSVNIELCGELSNDAVKALMRRSKILLHPSSYEGFATVYTEALYAGAHVVGFCQPMNEIFKNQHVVKTPEEMTARVDALLNDTNLNHDSVITWPIEATCQKVLALYGI